MFVDKRRKIQICSMKVFCYNAVQKLSYSCVVSNKQEKTFHVITLINKKQWIWGKQNLLQILHIYMTDNSQISYFWVKIESPLRPLYFIYDALLKGRLALEMKTTVLLEDFGSKTKCWTKVTIIWLLYNLSYLAQCQNCQS